MKIENRVRQLMQQGYDYHSALEQARNEMPNASTDFNDPTNRDTVPAMLTPDEFVLNKEAAQMYAPQAEAMNAHGLRQRHAENQEKLNRGGMVPPMQMAPPPMYGMGVQHRNWGGAILGALGNTLLNAISPDEERQLELQAVADRQKAFDAAGQQGTAMGNVPSMRDEIPPIQNDLPIPNSDESLLQGSSQSVDEAKAIQGNQTHYSENPTVQGDDLMFAQPVPQGQPFQYVPQLPDTMGSEQYGDQNAFVPIPEAIPQVEEINYGAAGDGLGDIYSSMDEGSLLQIASQGNERAMSELERRSNAGNLSGGASQFSMPEVIPSYTTPEGEYGEGYVPPMSTSPEGEFGGIPLPWERAETITTPDDNYGITPQAIIPNPNEENRDNQEADFANIPVGDVETDVILTEDNTGNNLIGSGRGQGYQGVPAIEGIPSIDYAGVVEGESQIAADNAEAALLGSKGVDKTDEDRAAATQVAVSQIDTAVNDTLGGLDTLDDDKKFNTNQINSIVNDPSKHKDLTNTLETTPEGSQIKDFASKALNALGFTGDEFTQMLSRTALYTLAGVLTGGSLGGSMRWAMQQSLGTTLKQQEAKATEGREAKRDARELRQQKDKESRDDQRTKDMYVWEKEQEAIAASNAGYKTTGKPTNFTNVNSGKITTVQYGDLPGGSKGYFQTVNQYVVDQNGQQVLDENGQAKIETITRPWVQGANHRKSVADDYTVDSPEAYAAAVLEASNTFDDGFNKKFTKYDGKETPAVDGSTASAELYEYMMQSGYDTTDLKQVAAWKKIANYAYDDYLRDVAKGTDRGSILPYLQSNTTKSWAANNVKVKALFGDVKDVGIRSTVFKDIEDTYMAGKSEGDFDGISKEQAMTEVMSKYRELWDTVDAKTKSDYAKRAKAGGKHNAFTLWVSEAAQ